jgi:UDPglucose 6-dehydrogenase
VAKKITVIGTGYAGLISAVGLADFGHTVTGVDVEKSIVDNLNHGKIPIYETGVNDYLQRNLKAGRLSFSTQIASAVKNAEVIFITVGTPGKEDGSADLNQLYSVVEVIKKNITDYKVIVTKSTVPVGTNRIMLQKLREININIDVVSNPEFLREGKAMHDFFHPDRIIIGVESERAKAVMEDIYRSLYLIQTPFVWCNLETAELIKYASNSFLATKITFMNQIANLADAVGADIHHIAKAMGMDGRISPKFLHPGPGFGGSCFPKDLRALAAIGSKHGVTMSLVEEVTRANQAQKHLMVEKLKSMLGKLQDKTIAVLGLAFKAETDDVRESSALTVVEELLAAGSKVRAHDPVAAKNFKKIFPAVDYFADKFEAIKGSDALVICTEWNEYRNLDLEKVRTNIKGNIILDARNILNKEQVKKLGFIYRGVGR